MSVVFWSCRDSLRSISLPARRDPQPIAERDHGDGDLRGPEESERERRADAGSTARTPCSRIPDEVDGTQRASEEYEKDQPGDRHD